MKREREPSGDATVRLLPPAAFYEGPARAYAAPVHVEGDQLAMITVPATSETGGSTPVTLRPSVEWLNPEPQLEQAERQDAHIKPIGAKARLMTEALEPPADAAKEMRVFPRYHQTHSNW